MESITITFTLPYDVAQLAYDEISGHLESLDYAIDSAEAGEDLSGDAGHQQRKRIAEAVAAVLKAMNDAGVEPAPLGTYAITPEDAARIRRNLGVQP